MNERLGVINYKIILFSVYLSFSLCIESVPADEPAVYPMAVFQFQERGKEVSELGAKVTDLLFARLSTEPSVYLVEREDMKQIIEEQQLNLSGLVGPAAATRVGQLTGAKILISGSVLQSDQTLYLIAKVIGTETSRVLGASAKGTLSDELDKLVDELAKQVVELMNSRAGELVAKPVTREDRLAKIKDALGKSNLPSIAVNVSERHIGQSTIDPAAATELEFLFTESGFKVLQGVTNTKSADVMVTGEGFSEFASRHGNLISVKARLELKVIERSSGLVLFADRHVSVGIDLSEQIAGKAALQEAASQLALRLLPALARISEDIK